MSIDFFAPFQLIKQHAFRFPDARAIGCGFCLMLVLTAVTEMPLARAKADPQAQFQEKLYRQALYFYFAGDYAGALRQIGLNRQRFDTDTAKTDLFEAGLQVSVGLHDKAAKTLARVNHQQPDLSGSPSPGQRRDGASSTAADEIRLIALLQLTEQQLQRGETSAAKQTLSQLGDIPAPYASQYRILSQLVYWPEPAHMPAQFTEQPKTTQADAAATSLSTAYIALNNALLHINQGEFELAAPLLMTVKSRPWLAANNTFWQRLFNPFATLDSQSSPAGGAPAQQQAIGDYARLLMAQMYVKRQDYQAAYQELADFPKDSPYSESALFLFAYAAQKTQQFTLSLKLLELMQQAYPYSHLGWQSALLMAIQLEGQGSFKQAMARYLQAEQLYLQTLADLEQFQQAFNASDDLLGFGLTQVDAIEQEMRPANKHHPIATYGNIAPLAISTPSAYVSQSPWLKKALLDPGLQSVYHKLVELDLLAHHLQALQAKSQWIEASIDLNKRRKANVLAMKTQNQHGAVIARLDAKQHQLSQQISRAEKQADGRLFATAGERQQLARIQRSRQALDRIAPHRNISDDEKRLARLTGVLSWQLHQAFPERLWQHQKLLQQVRRQLAMASDNNTRFEVLANSQGRLADYEMRLQRSNADAAGLLKSIAGLRRKTTTDIHTRVQGFVSAQQSTLAQFLLTSRHKMAGVLEKMSAADLQAHKASIANSRSESAQALGSQGVPSQHPRPQNLRSRQDPGGGI